MSSYTPSPRILSIQSHVVHGYVGNKSCTFPLQVLGFEVDAINTVQFSNHTGYKHVKGSVLSNSELQELLEGLSLNNLDDYAYLLTAYTRDPAALLQVADTLKRLRENNPDLIYVCDPVMGDNGFMYVPEEILPVYRDSIVPLADILTPNQYEAELLTGLKIENINQARAVINVLHEKGVKTVVISSSELGDEKNMIGLASSYTGKCYMIAIPKVKEFNFTGTGDLFTALFLAWFHKSNKDIKCALEKTIATMQTIVWDTYHFAKELCVEEKPGRNKRELRIIQNKENIENPKITIQAKELSS